MDNAIPAILVMDDDPHIRQIVPAMLEQLGYRASTCINGEEAIELYQAAMESGTPFVAVIIDVVIASGMGGVHAAREILRIDPGARLIVSSGYAHEPVMAAPRDYWFRAGLRKPFTIAQLAAVLDALL